MLSQYSGDKFFNMNYYLNIIEQQKIVGIIGMLKGIAMAIGGTLLLQEKRNPIPVQPMDEAQSIDDFDESYKKWRF